MSPGRRVTVVIIDCWRYRNGGLLRGIKKGDRVTFSYAGPAAR